MSSATANLRGILFMVLSTGFFSANDAFMKLATVGLPPFEVLFLRGVMASLLALPVVLLTGNGPALRHVADLASDLADAVRQLEVALGRFRKRLAAGSDPRVAAGVW